MSNTNNTVKVDLISVNTQKSEKSVKSLKTRIKELRLELESLDEGTAEYNEKLLRLSELQHQNTELTENIRRANVDYGNTLQVTQKAVTGLIASYTAVVSTMNLLGTQNEETTESILKVQSALALLTALSQLDEAEKSFQELYNRIKSVVTVRNEEQKETQDSTIKTQQNTQANKANAQSLQQQNTAISGGSKAIGIFKNGIKSLVTSLKNFALSNPFTLILAGITACITAISHFKKKAEEAKIKASELANDNITKLLRQTKEVSNVDITDKNLAGTYAETSTVYDNTRKNLEEYKEKYKLFKITNEEIEKANKEYIEYQKQSNALVDKWGKMSKAERESAEGLSLAINMYHNLILTYNREAVYLEKELQKLHNELLTTDENSKLYQSKLNSYNELLEKFTENEEKIKNAIKANDNIRNKINANNEKILADEKEAKDKELEQTKARWDKEISELKAKIAEEQEQNKLNLNKKEISEEQYYRKSIEIYENYLNSLNALKSKGNQSVTEIDTLSAENNKYEAEKVLKEYQLQLIEQREILSEQLSVLTVDETIYIKKQIDELNNTISSNEKKMLELKDISLRQQYELLKKQNTLTEEEQIQHLDNMLNNQIQYIEDEKKVLKYNYDRDNSILSETFERDEEALKFQYEKKLIDEVTYNQEYARLKADFFQSLINLDNEYNLNKIDLEFQLTQAEAEYSNKRYEIQKNEIERKIGLQEMYFDAVSNVYGNVATLLGTLQGMYDENSKAYKNIARTQIIADTISGSVSAYKSGVSSGLPAPANLIYGGVLAGLVTANGLLQLHNLEAERISNTTTSSAVNNVGSTYETLAYATSLNDINNNIRDSKVFVLESEISEVSNRVRVYENESRF